jgi:hypothetical protein
VRDSIQSDAILVTLYATSVSGTLDVDVYATTDDTGEEALLFSFPQLTAATTNLLLRRSSVIPARFRIVATYSAACTYEVHVRAVNAGTSDVRIIGASNATAYSVTIGPAVSVLIPAPVLDRRGLVLKNYSLTNTMFIGFTAAEATLAGGGWPMAPQEQLGVDVEAGVAIYASATGADTDVRIIEAGG